MSTACCRCRFSGADCRQPGAGAPDCAPDRALADYHGRLADHVWPDPLSAAATVVSSHAYLWMTAGLSFYAFGIGLANAGLVRLTLFASEMSKGTVSAAMGMLQMLIFTVGIELSKHAYELGGNGLFSLFNLLGGVLWLGLMIYFLKDKSVGNSQQGVVVFNPDALASGSYQANGAS